MTAGGTPPGWQPRAARPSHRRGGNRSDEIAGQIKDLILVQGLAVGDAMPTEADLCLSLGVSRSSLREAIRTLTTLGIVEVRHGHGMYVGRMSLNALVQTLVFRGTLQPGADLSALHEIVEIRQSLDLSMAEQVTAALANTSNPELTVMVNRMIERSHQKSMFANYDRDFHTALLSRTGNSIIGPLVGAFWDVHDAVMPRLGVSLPTDLTQTARAHEQMLRAAEAGEAEEYRAAVRRHYEPLLRSLDRKVRS